MMSAASFRQTCRRRIAPEALCASTIVASMSTGIRFPSAPGAVTGQRPFSSSFDGAGYRSPSIGSCWFRPGRWFRRGCSGRLAAGQEVFHAFHSEEGVTTAMKMGAVCRAPTWVKNAAIKTIENGAATASPATRSRVPSGLIRNKRLVGGGSGCRSTGW